MPIKLIKQAFNGNRPPPRMWRQHPLKGQYDVVIIGGGAHGLACAYYLAKNHGITNVAVLEKRYIGSGGSGRNTTIIRSNYLTPEGVRFYDESVKLYETMSAEFDFNVMFSQRGHLTLAHTDGALRTMRERFLKSFPDRRFTFVSRPASASPAVGSHRQHGAEQRELVDRALGVTQSSPGETSSTKTAKRGKP